MFSPSQPRIRQCGLWLGALALSVLLAQARDVWKEKPAAQWTAEEALKVVTDSPWAHQEYVGFVMPLPRAGSYTNPVGAMGPTVPGTPPPSPREPLDGVGMAVYLVRWECATPVKEAFTRLDELGQRASAHFQSPPPALPDDRYVITVKTTRPPRGVRDVFEGVDDEALKKQARLKTSEGEFAPLEVGRSGVGATAAVHFFFSRTAVSQPLKRRERVEFRFKGAHFTVKSKFSLEREFVR